MLWLNSATFLWKDFGVLCQIFYVCNLDYGKHTLKFPPPPPKLFTWYIWVCWSEVWLTWRYWKPIQNNFHGKWFHSKVGMKQKQVSPQHSNLLDHLGQMRGILVIRVSRMTPDKPDMRLCWTHRTGGPWRGGRVCSASGTSPARIELWNLFNYRKSKESLYFAPKFWAKSII